MTALEGITSHWREYDAPIVLCHLDAFSPIGKLGPVFDAYKKMQREVAFGFTVGFLGASR